MKRVWKWLVSWFNKETVNDENEFSVSLYKPIERYVYKYFNGKEIVAKDPFILHRRINDNAHALKTDIQAAGSDWKFKDKCRQDLLATIRLIFDLKPLDEGGLTEQETFALLDHYLTYEHFQKKTANLSPTTPEQSPSPPPSTSGGDLPTKNISDSNSTGSESSTSVPTSSPSEPVSPSASLNRDLNTSGLSPTAS